MIPPTTNAVKRKPAPAGLQLARCVQVIDLGTQPAGKHTPRRKVLLGFELPRCPRETADDTQECYIVWENFTLTLYEKGRLRPFVEAWLGKKLTPSEVATFDLKSLLGKVCQLLLVHNESDGTTYANIQTIVPADSDGFPDQQNENKYFFINDFDREVFETFGDSLQSKIKRSPEYQAKVGGVDEVFAEADDIPF